MSDPIPEGSVTVPDLEPEFNDAEGIPGDLPTPGWDDEAPTPRTEEDDR